jgi:dihydroorotate dehydrogenase (fumarate)
VTDLRTTYLGLELASPIVASPSPLTGDLESAKLLEEAGAAALVLPSLFEEELIHEDVALNRALELGSGHTAEAHGFFPTIDGFASVADRYLTRLEAMRAQLEIPVIASLNAAHNGSWARYAALLESAGATAIELNLYRVAADPDQSAADVEAVDLDIIAGVRAAVAVPLAVKLGPHYSAFAHFAREALGAGADGLVLFNRFYQPDIDLEELDVVNRIELSRPSELRLPLRWLAVLRPQLGDAVSLAATSGVHNGTEVIKAIMCGADVAMLTSALLIHGAGHLRIVHDELLGWMTAHGYESVAQMRGSATQATASDPAAFERANYVAALHSWAAPSHHP